jgi:predicted phosphoadenosine phosphosulfate sulfurtransferase
MSKISLNKNVYDATMERLELIFQKFDTIYLSFSAGKDSSVMIQLAMQVARKHNKKF